MTARAFLVRGLLVGLLAGFATFLVAHEVGEPHVETAIALEEASSAGDRAADAGHSHDEGTEVSRPDQRTWGLLTGSVAVGVAVGGIVALVAASVVGRIGRMSPGRSTALVSLIGFVSVALVPFLKYPATPPAVGSGDTIGDRTSYFFGFVLISVAFAAFSSLLAIRLIDDIGTYAAVLAGVGVYVVAVVVAGQLMPTVNEVGDFPADVLWYFRRASLITLATLWAVIGVGLTGLVGRLHRREADVVQRRALAATL
ncbi:CbtA family protein [Nocardioides sp. YIM 152315]|uniref:CbtA family protein n=1 Tax=Nocardioides sp. YIM 152315 TaxID=3031760 RepID=UPI0023DBA575|nr:CbtA family protein [Nocardioides sp. YIM 152315]MDF1601997.1 CbtA family protein [Nocardioides sp. YIM 152315]